MTNAFATNFAIPSSTSTFQVLWKLTRVMKAAGWAVKSHSDGVTKTAAGTNANDSWGNTSSGTTPLLDSYPAFDAAAPWIVLSGPTTLKIPLNAAPTGTPLRGETVTQTATSFEGELLGYVWDSVGLSGYAVILPRVNTPTNATNIVGSTSGAALVPTGTIVTYAREIMFSKASSGNLNNGLIYYICADALGSEANANLFSTLATNASCTATIPPGASSATSGTANGFPGKAICIRGNGGSTSIAEWFQVASAFGAHAQLGCINAISGAGVSADGSFYAALSTTTAGNINGFAFTRLDDTEPGDIDPYVWYFSQTNSFSSWTRLSQTSYGTSSTSFNPSNFISIDPPFMGYQSRGGPVSARDIPCVYGGTITFINPNSSFLASGKYPNPLRLVNHPAATPPLIREPFCVYTTGDVPSSLLQIKGRTRWIAAFSAGSALDTYDNKTWFSVATASTGTSPAIALFYDGTTVPLT